MSEHENWIDWARQSAEAEIRDLRVEWQAALARAEAAEALLAQWKLLGQQESERAEAAIVRAQTAEAALANLMADCQTETDDLLADCAGELERVKAALAQCRHDLAEVIERKEVLRNCWEQAEVALQAAQTPCVWTPTGTGWADSGYDTGCGAWYQKAVGEVADFCVRCGHRIEVVQP